MIPDRYFADVLPQALKHEIPCVWLNARTLETSQAWVKYPNPRLNTHQNLLLQFALYRNSDQSPISATKTDPAKTRSSLVHFHGSKIRWI